MSRELKTAFARPFWRGFFDGIGLIIYFLNQFVAFSDKIVQKNIFGLVGEIKYGFRFTDNVVITVSVGGNINQQRSLGTAAFGFVYKGGLFN